MILVRVRASAFSASLFDLAYSRTNVHDWPHTCMHSHTYESHWMFTKQQHQRPQFRLNEFHMVQILRCTCVYILFSLSIDSVLSLSDFSMHVFLNTQKAETESALGMNLMILFKIIIISSNYVIIISVKMNVLLHNNAATPITPPLFNSLAHSIVIVIAVIHYFCIFGCACIRFSLHIRNANIVQLIVIIASIAWKSA